MPSSLASLPPPSKKRKIQNDPAFFESIQNLETNLSFAVSNNGSLNQLSDLLDLARATKVPQHTSKAIYALYRSFVLIITSDKLVLGEDEAAKTVKAWLWEKLNAYVEYIGSLLKDEDTTLRISSLQILMSLQKHLSTSYSKSDPSRPQFQLSHFRKIVSFLLLCPHSTRQQTDNSPRSSRTEPDVLNYFHETWLGVHDDIRWFFLRESATLLDALKDQSDLTANILSAFEQLTTFPTEQSKLGAWWVAEMGAEPLAPKSSKNGSSASGDEMDENTSREETADDDWRKFFDEDTAVETHTKSKLGAGSARLQTLTIHQSLHSLASHRAVFTRAWLTLLTHIAMIPNAQDRMVLQTRALNIMHHAIMPHLTRPVLIMDWVAGSVDVGGTVGLLALNALFILMKQYNLDYPSFYTRLYAFIDRDLLCLRHRARFFRMAEVFLSSTHLPANLLASFVKRLSRLSLSAPPAAIIMLVPFTYNILKRHPVLMAMIHRAEAEVDGSLKDPFLPSELNPLHTQAHLSSLWELVSHRSHYHSSVSTLAKIFSEAFTKPNFAMEDFLDHTYATLFETEMSRKIMKDPALVIGLESAMSMNLFPAIGGSAPKAVGAGLEMDAVNELWRF